MLNPIRPARSLLCAARPAGFRGPELRIDLSAHRDDLVAQLDGWPAERQALAVEGQHENSTHFVFANGSVKITSAPGGATVLADGRTLGQTPLGIEGVKPGDVTYE